MNEVALSFTDLQSMAGTMSKSGMFGKTPEQLLSLMLIAQAEGIHPAIAAMEYDIIQGRPALKGQAALARFQQAGGRIDWLTRTDAEAKAKFYHPQGGELVVSWDKAKALKAGLWDKRGKEGQETPWQKIPGVMLSWRVVAEGVRAIFPACLNRMYLAEEVQDFEPMKNVTPNREPEAVIKEAVPVETIPDDLAEKAATLTKKAGLSDKEKATTLTKKAGLSDKEKAAIFMDCGRDVNKYIAKLESVLAEPGPDFALENAPAVDMSYLILELEEYERSDATPEAAKKDIRAAFARKENDLGKLSALLERVKTAGK